MTLSRRIRRVTASLSTTDEKRDRKGALVLTMRPWLSTLAIAMGVELKKRVNLTSAARNSAEASSPWVRFRTIVLDGPPTPPLLAETRCMKRTGSAFPDDVDRSRSKTEFRVDPGSALTARTSAMPSPATMSWRRRPPGTKPARSMPSQPASCVQICDAASLIRRKEAGRRLIEMIDRLLQVEEKAFLFFALMGNVGKFPGRQRLPEVWNSEWPCAHPVPARTEIGPALIGAVSLISPSPLLPSRRSSESFWITAEASGVSDNKASTVFTSTPVAASVRSAYARLT